MHNNTDITSNNNSTDNNDNQSTQRRGAGRRARLGLVAAAVASVGVFAAATPASASTCSSAQDPGFLGGVVVAAGDVDASDVDASDYQVWRDNFGSTAASTSTTVAGTDTYSFGVEREMKESGEKGGTADINIGVGELQECTISKSMDMASTKLTQFAINADSLGLAEIEQADEASTGQPICYLQYKLSR